MKLTELLSKKVPYQIVGNDSIRFATRATINGRDIEFFAQKIMDYHDEWEIAFAEMVPKSIKKQTYDTTGKGGQFDVFSMVAESMKEFIDRYSPNSFRYSADPARQKLYAKLMSKLPSYEMVDVDEDGYKLHPDIRRFVKK